MIDHTEQAFPIKKVRYRRKYGYSVYKRDGLDRVPESILATGWACFRVCNGFLAAIEPYLMGEKLN